MSQRRTIMARRKDFARLHRAKITASYVRSVVVTNPRRDREREAVTHTCECIFMSEHSVRLFSLSIYITRRLESRKATKKKIRKIELSKAALRVYNVTAVCYVRWKMEWAEKILRRREREKVYLREMCWRKALFFKKKTVNEISGDSGEASTVKCWVCYCFNDYIAFKPFNTLLILRANNSLSSYVRSSEKHIHQPPNSFSIFSETVSNHRGHFLCKLIALKASSFSRIRNKEQPPAYSRDKSTGRAQRKSKWIMIRVNAWHNTKTSRARE